MTALLSSKPITAITLEQLRATVTEFAATYPTHQPRIARAARLMATHTPEAVPNISGVWLVASEETDTTWIVMQGPTPLADGCTCPDFKHRGQRCKHIWLVRVYQACISCSEPTTGRSGGYPLCPPCGERDMMPEPENFQARYARVRADAEAAERRGDDATAARLAREYQRMTNQITEQQARCSKCNQVAALSQGICGSCLVNICYQD